MENPFSLKEKTMGQTPNNFTVIKSITIILVYVSRLKKNLSYVSLLSHTLSLCLMVKEKSPYFSLLSHTLSLCFLEANPLLSLPWLSPGRRQHFTLSSLVIFSKEATFCSLLLGYLLKSGNTLLSPP